MWGNGYSASDIAKSLGGGLTRNAVIGKAHRLKLSAGVAAPPRQMPDAPSKTPGVVMTTITKISKKRAMLRASLPPVSASRSETLARVLAREPLSGPLEALKRTEGIPVPKQASVIAVGRLAIRVLLIFASAAAKRTKACLTAFHHARIAYQTVSRKARANAK
jgi:hypothetical protein